jgi:hypothetical protein
MTRWGLLAVGVALACGSNFSAKSHDETGGGGSSENGSGSDGGAGSPDGTGGADGGTNGTRPEGGEGGSGAEDSTGGMGGGAGGGTGGAGGSSDAGVGAAGSAAAGRAGGFGGNAGSAGSSAGTGGSEEPCPQTFTVSNVGYVRMPNKAGTCWRGPATSGGDATSSWTPKTFELCGPNCVLSITGTVNAATAENNYAGLVNLSFSLAQLLGATNRGDVTPTGTGLTLTYAATGATNVRIEIASATVSYCYGLPTETGPNGSTLDVPYTAFARRCWDASQAVQYAKEPIEKISLTAPGGLVPHDYVLKLVKVEEY